ncbi:MAG: hypothetical protein C4B58_15545 [Deltaproteobacteria bacterium]|nr:MAG: hypothetical protein C4B58_15545 [Deltaproteobacteria bacterium]
MIAKVVGLDRSVISRNVQNTKIGNMHNLLSQGHDMDYIARHYHMNLALVWALQLAGKTDQEKFKKLGWGLRTWDLWNWNDCLFCEIHVNDSEAYFPGVMNDSEMTGPVEYRRNSSPTHYSISQNLVILSSIRWPAAA